MSEGEHRRCTAFEGSRRIASGTLEHVARQTKEATDRSGHAPLLIFDDETGEQVEFDCRATVDKVPERPVELASDAAGPVEDRPRGPGRPRLGVVAREVTLLPRHWDWLNSQPGGASVALRKLVEEARRRNAGKDLARRSQEAAYRFMAALAGNFAGFEEATRALFAGDRGRFEDHSGPWPADVREYARRLAADSFHAAGAS